jgi:hypothetical protein
MGVAVAGNGSVNDESVAARDRSLFKESASSERKNVVVVVVVVVVLLEFVVDTGSPDVFVVADVVRACGVIGVS